RSPGAALAGAAPSATSKGVRNPAGSPSRIGPGRTMSAVFGRRASQQAVQSLQVAKGNLRSGNASSQGSGLTYDGGRGALGKPSVAGGRAVDGGGLSSGLADTPAAATANDLKNVPAPPAIEKTKNKTPYQKLIYGAIAALAIGMIALLLAGHFMKLAQAGNLAMLLPARLLAGLAAMAGLAAAALGAIIWNKYDQMAQGMMFVMAGGMLTLQAGKVLLDSFAGEHAKKEMDSQVGQADKAIYQKLDVTPAAQPQAPATQQLGSMAQQSSAGMSLGPAASPGLTAGPAVPPIVP
ncbi:MAG: hypothetical protein WCI75_17255, partial [candidate division NC10 bacterium]